MVRQVIPLVVVLAIGTTLVGLFQSQRSAAATASSGLDAEHQNLLQTLGRCRGAAQKAEAELSQGAGMQQPPCLQSVTLQTRRRDSKCSSSSHLHWRNPSPHRVRVTIVLCTLLTTCMPPGIKPGDLMMTTYATGGVREMLYNWVLHVQRLGLPILVSAMDKQVVEQRLRSASTVWTGRTPSVNDKSYVHGSFDGFRALGVRKLDALLPVRRVNVVLSDVDCVWSASLLPMFHGQVRGFEDFALADVILATDCMSPDLDAPKDGRVPGCYRDTVDKNTGVIAVRATKNGIATMAEWKIRLAVGQKDEQDQTTFNDLLDGNERGHRWGMDWAARNKFRSFAEEWCARRRACAASTSPTKTRTTVGSRRIFEVCLPNATRDALVGIFPITEVAGGHTFFVQQLQSPTAKWPMAVHATYQFGDQPDYPFGKRQRFRDWGMWLVDDDAELVTASRYLVLEDDAPLAPREDWVGYSDLHVRAAARQPPRAPPAAPRARLRPRARAQPHGGAADALVLLRQVLAPASTSARSPLRRTRSRCRSCAPSTMSSTPASSMAPRTRGARGRGWACSRRAPTARGRTACRTAAATGCASWAPIRVSASRVQRCRRGRRARRASRHLPA